MADAPAGRHTSLASMRKRSEICPLLLLRLATAVSAPRILAFAGFSLRRCKQRKVYRDTDADGVCVLLLTFLLNVHIFTFQCCFFTHYLQVVAAAPAPASKPAAKPAVPSVVPKAVAGRKRKGGDAGWDAI